MYVCRFLNMCAYIKDVPSKFTQAQACKQWWLHPIFLSFSPTFICRLNSSCLIFFSSVFFPSVCSLFQQNSLKMFGWVRARIFKRKKEDYFHFLDKAIKFISLCISIYVGAKRRSVYVSPILSKYSFSASPMQTSQFAIVLSSNIVCAVSSTHFILN